MRLGVCAACTNFKITHSLDSGITPNRCYVLGGLSALNLI